MHTDFYVGGLLPKDAFLFSYPSPNFIAFRSPALRLCSGQVQKAGIYNKGRGTDCQGKRGQVLEADLNYDFKVDFADFDKLAGNWLEGS